MDDDLALVSVLRIEVINRKWANGGANAASHERSPWVGDPRLQSAWSGDDACAIDANALLLARRRVTGGTRQAPAPQEAAFFAAVIEKEAKKRDVSDPTPRPALSLDA